MIAIQLPDGSKREFPQPVTVADVAASIGAGLAKAALGGRVGAPGATKLVDTSYLIEADESLAIVTAKDPDGLDLIRHSTAHLLAYAVKELFPDAQVTIGPVDRERLLLRLRLQAPVHAGRPGRHREEDGGARRQGREGDAPRAAARRGRRALQGHGRGLQGRDHRQHSRGPGRVAVPRRRVRGPVPRPARAVHGQAASSSS